MDEYCEKYNITSYAFLKENSTSSTSQIFMSNSLKSIMNSDSEFIIRRRGISEIVTASPPRHNNNLMITAQPTIQFIKIRSLIDRGIKFVEKKLNLEEFLTHSNTIINNMASFNTIHSSNNTNNILSPLPLFNYFHNFLNKPSTGTISTSSMQNTLNNASNYAELVSAILTHPSINSINSTPSIKESTTSLPNNPSSTPVLNSTSSQLNITILTDTWPRQQSNERGLRRQKLENQLLNKIGNVLTLFNSKTRIELIAMEVQDNVIQCLASGLRLDMDENHFNSNWSQCLERLNNAKNRKQLVSFKLDEILCEMRYVRKSKVFIFYSLKSDQFKLIVIP